MTYVQCSLSNQDTLKGRHLTHVSTPKTISSWNMGILHIIILSNSCLSTGVWIREVFLCFTTSRWVYLAMGYVHLMQERSLYTQCTSHISRAEGNRTCFLKANSRVLCQRWRMSINGHIIMYMLLAKSYKAASFVLAFFCVIESSPLIICTCWDIQIHKHAWESMSTADYIVLIQMCCTSDTGVL